MARWNGLKILILISEIHVKKLKLTSSKQKKDKNH